MLRRTPRSTRTHTLFPYTPRVRSVIADAPGEKPAAEQGAQRGQRQQDVIGHDRRAAQVERVVDAVLFDRQEQAAQAVDETEMRSEEHTSELQSLMRISYAVFC